ncbi:MULTISPECIES: PAS domain-containing methyl-accepting chemotaxis protein [unclassified Halomonas]|uniref:methyl-accepting chemotaxis protein n=1 Tax=unclassified Halomonas TaxID=2609666 RepID=UPI00209E113D|nr:MULTISPECIES: PAS domain-containing methyl-accepting chemotaxis protein [unclassified Halomonas]MCP1313232.1 PAS domain-containing methyl-accepting chemotaxis protein [Halomonas sp. 707D7]MCP1326080.1 PAS domain-containing methyl-accepting chemotaxis protein [Halomonas sp. 707D4]
MLTFMKHAALPLALQQHTASIHFSPDGLIQEASPLFLETMGYTLEEIAGRHHSLFCTPEEVASPDYQRFWAALAGGEPQQGSFRRISASGEDVWLEAIYLPVRNRRRKVVSIVKIASDISRQHASAQSHSAVLKALDSSMAVIEFAPDGTILSANANFERTMGYKSEAIAGRHHRMFCTVDFVPQLDQFWSALASGQFKQGKFERLHGEGHSVWLEATYNPVFDDQGRVTKVVKFATDITRAVEENEAAKRAVLTAQSTSSQTEQIAQNGLTHLHRVLEESRQASKTLEDAQALMTALNKQAQTINAITESIARIANQTNLLSLNAAVEAARAGEQGRGFAVVAHEVRQLARGSSEAVTEITRVLKENSELVERTSLAVSQVVEQGRHNQTSVGEIETIVNEILTGARGVSDSVDQLALQSA